MARFIASALVAALLAATPAGALDIGDLDGMPMAPEAAAIGFQKFLRAHNHRAFAVAPGGGWAWRANKRTQLDAEQGALKRCEQHAKRPCLLYAVNDRVVFDRAAWTASLGPYLDADAAAAADVGDKLGQRFPDLAFKAPNGAERSISDFAGSVLFLQLFGTWSPNAHKELPDIQKLRDILKGDDGIAFAFLPMRENIAEATAWAKKWGVTLPLYDAGGDGSRYLTLANGEKIPFSDLSRRFPITYVLDARGIVVFRKVRAARGWREFAPLLKHVSDGTR